MKHDSWRQAGVCAATHSSTRITRGVTVSPVMWRRCHGSNPGAVGNVSHVHPNWGALSCIQLYTLVDEASDWVCDPDRIAMSAARPYPWLLVPGDATGATLARLYHTAPW